MKEQGASQLRIALAGSVVSSHRTLQGLLRHRVKLVGVLGLSAEMAREVSGYCRLDDIAESAGVPYLDFRTINHPEVVEAVSRWSPDLLFVVGLSQLVKPELLAVPRLGCVGFHPTRLPEGRGRAPVAWLTLDGHAGAATFFLMDEGMDSGPILAQEQFDVTREDYASDVVTKLECAIDTALDRWLPRLVAGEWEPVPQEHAAATYTGKRAPEDGLIDWHQQAEQIHALIRAASRPHPGAYTYVNNHKLTIWRAQVEPQPRIRGVIGRIVDADADRGYLAQTGQGLLWLTEIEFAPSVAGTQFRRLRVGMRLGHALQDEVFALNQKVAKLEERIIQLELLNNQTR